MGTIEALIPTARQADTDGLRAADADELARYVLDTAQPWWRRRPCAAALAGRVPPAHVPGLIERIRDRRDVAEVRIALLDVLGDRQELLPWLRQVDSRTESYGMPEAILKARGTFGDRTAVRDLATLAFDPWPHRRVVGEAGMDALVARYGAEAIVADLGDARPEDRAFRVRMRHRAGRDVLEALEDPDVRVACFAHSLADDEEGLRSYLRRAPTTDAKLWTLCALYRLNADLTESRAIYDELGRPRVEIDGLDDEIRGAILAEYAPHAQDGTGPRWRAEAIFVNPPPPADQDDQLRRAAAALASGGLAPEPPVSAGDANRQGAGTYHEIAHAGGMIFVSTLGRFVTGDDGNVAARSALESAGFRWIDEALGAIVVTGLCVYYFGHREPLKVDTLLFYWQD